MRCMALYIDYFLTLKKFNYNLWLGRHFRMGVLINKESVTARMASSEGMSFMEFTYQLIQAYDYLRLHEEKVSFKFININTK